MPPPGFAGPPQGEPQPQPSVPAPSRSPSRVTRGRSRLLAGSAGAGVLAVIAVLAFLLLGSGGAQLGGPIAQAAMLSSATPGYRMHMSMVLTSSALDSTITATGTGVIDLRDHASALSLAMNLGDEPQVTQVLGSSTMRVEMVLDGATAYMRLPSALTASLGTPGRQWIKADLSKLSGVPGLSSLANGPTTSDPAQALQELRSASEAVVDLGRQRVDGFETTHYQAQMSVDRLAGTVPPAERTAMDQILTTLKHALPTGAIPVDVWIDADHLVRRVTTTLDLSLPTGGTNLQETVTIDIADYGPQQPAAPPPTDEVFDLSSAAG